MRTLIHSALRYLVNKLTSSSELKLNKRVLELLLSSRLQYNLERMLKKIRQWEVCGENVDAHHRTADHSLHLAQSGRYMWGGCRCGENVEIM